MSQKIVAINFPAFTVALNFFFAGNVECFHTMDSTHASSSATISDEVIAFRFAASEVGQWRGHLSIFCWSGSSFGTHLLHTLQQPDVHGHVSNTVVREVERQRARTQATHVSRPASSRRNRRPCLMLTDGYFVLVHAAVPLQCAQCVPKTGTLHQLWYNKLFGTKSKLW